MDYEAFVKSPKALLISPAGYGKTHTIVECLKHTHGKQLILTHTHAGISSIMDKIKSSGIDSKSYCIETISSFAQKYVHAFYTGHDFPEQNSREYHPFITHKAAAILNSSIVRMVIRHSYAGLFVDEYQDCTKDQHNMILALVNELPTRIFGDPLQGIFDFNGDAVVFHEDLSEFIEFPELQTPQRWYREGNNKKPRFRMETFKTLIVITGNV